MPTIEITVDTTAIQKLQGVAARIPEAIDGALQDVIEDVVLPEATVQTGAIADRPIWNYPSGIPMWERDETLLNSMETEFGRGYGQLAWTAIYARRRFGLGVTWMPRRPAGGIIRKNNVPSDTVESIKPRIEPVFSAGFKRRLGI